MALSICIVGDLTYDAVTHLVKRKINEIEQSFYAREPIELVVGGTALNPAIQAKKLGFSEVCVVSKIGVNQQTKEPDLPAREMITCLNEIGVKHHLIPDENAPTGKTMITYFDGDERILVADRAANRSFNIRQITPELLTLIQHSDILFISGYWLMIEEQAKATVRLMEASRKKGNLVVLDLVPHKIYEILTLETFLKYSQSVDVLVGESNTVSRLFPELGHFIDSFSDSPEIAEVVLGNYHYNSLILMPTNDVQYTYNRRGLIVCADTGYSEASREHKRGFLDGATMKVLYDFYEQFRN